MSNAYSMADFIQNLFNALFVIVRQLGSMTADINGSTISVMDMVVYSGIITLVMSIIKDISHDGLFTFDKENRRKLE